MRLKFNLLTGQFELLDSAALPTTEVLNGTTDFGDRNTEDLVIDMGFRTEDQSILDQGLRI